MKSGDGGGDGECVMDVFGLPAMRFLEENDYVYH